MTSCFTVMGPVAMRGRLHGLHLNFTKNQSAVVKILIKINMQKVCWKHKNLSNYISIN